MKRPILLLVGAAIALGILLATSLGWAHEGHNHAKVPARVERQDLKHELPAQDEPGKYSSSLQAYLLPDVTLVNAEDRPVRLFDMLASERPIMIDFMSTNCSETCLQVGKTLSTVARKLRSEAPGLRLMSIAVDPVHDRPAQLKAYARQFGASGNWQIYTGGTQDIEALTRAFDAQRPEGQGVEPLAHRLVLLRPGPGQPWLRIEGTPSAEDLAREYRNAMKK